MGKFKHRREYGMTLSDRIVEVVERNGVRVARAMLWVTGEGRKVSVWLDEADASRPGVGDVDWYVNGTMMRVYRTKSGAMTKSGRTTEYITRAIMDPPEGLVVDHVNGDTLDNTRQNLRVCTYSQNNMNVSIRRSHNSTGFLGVQRSKSGTFFGIIVKDGKRVWREGGFMTAQAAWEARQAQLPKYHGVFAAVGVK